MLTEHLVRLVACLGQTGFGVIFLLLIAFLTLLSLQFIWKLCCGSRWSLGGAFQGNQDKLRILLGVICEGEQEQYVSHRATLGFSEMLLVPCRYLL